jgi:hypothetical protein
MKLRRLPSKNKLKNKRRFNRHKKRIKEKETRSWLKKIKKGHRIKTSLVLKFLQAKKLNKFCKNSHLELGSQLF